MLALAPLRQPDKEQLKHLYLQDVGKVNEIIGTTSDDDQTLLLVVA